MNSVHCSHTLARFSQTAVYSLLVAFLLTISARSIMAQGAPPNMDFNDGIGNARYNSTGNAFIGAVTGNIQGRIKNRVVNYLDVVLVPDVNGPHRLRKLVIDYNASNSIIPPTVQWYDLGATKRLVITNVPAREYFSGSGPYSKGLAKVEIIFNGGAGKATVTYTHSVYSNPPPSSVRAYNGTVFSGSPLAGRRLYYELR
jgi:hypothetical protein